MREVRDEPALEADSDAAPDVPAVSTDETPAEVPARDTIQVETAEPAPATEGEAPIEPVAETSTTEEPVAAPASDAAPETPVTAADDAPPVPVVLIEGHITEDLYVKLSDSDIAELARKQTEMRAERAAAASLRTAKMKALKGKMDGLDGEIDEIDEIIRAGRDLRPVRLTIILLASPPEKRYVDPEGNVIRKVPLSDRELAKVAGQGRLPLAGNARDVSGAPRLVKSEKPGTSDSGEVAPADPMSRALRAAALARVEGAGGEQIRMLAALGFLDPGRELVDRYVAERRAGSIALEELAAAAPDALDQAEPNLAAWLEANSIYAESTLKKAEAGERTSGVVEIDEFVAEIRVERAYLEANALAAADAPLAAIPEPMPDGVGSIEVAPGPYNVGCWRVVVTDGNLAESLRDVALHLGGTSEYDEAMGTTTIECPVEPRRIIAALRNEENPIDAVARALDSDESFTEVYRYIASTFDGTADLKAAIDTHSPHIEVAMKDAGDGPLPLAVAAGRAWLVAAERLLADRTSGADATESFFVADEVGAIEPDPAAAEPATIGVDPAVPGSHKTVGVVINATTKEVVRELSGDETEEIFGARPAPPSREMRKDTEQLFADGPEYDAFRSAHTSGILDPTEDELRTARRELDPDGDLTELGAMAADDAQAYEEDLIRELRGSAPGRVALTRGKWPTGVAKVDAEIGHVRRVRAKLEVVQEWNRDAAPRPSVALEADAASPTPKRRRRKAGKGEAA